MWLPSLLFTTDGGIVRNYDKPPEKDTVVTPNGGYTVVEFVADNPGWWMLHCHMEDHLEVGKQNFDGRRAGGSPSKKKIKMTYIMVDYLLINLQA